MPEMAHGLRSLGLGFSEEDIAALAAAADADSDGSIDYTEFVSYFKPARQSGGAAPASPAALAASVPQLALQPAPQPAREPPASGGTDA